MSHQEILEYICELLNINLKNKLVSDKILMTLKDMSVSYDLVKFGDFLESSFNYERFRYLTGYQKFLSMANEFKRDNELKLSDEMENKALDKSNELFSKLTNFIDTCYLDCQELGKNIYNLDLEQTLLKQGFEKYQISIIRAIGSKENTINLCLYGKEDLRARIESIVNKKALMKMYPQLQNKKSEDMKVLEKLKLGIKNGN